MGKVLLADAIWKMMPSALGQNIMEKQKLSNNAASSFGGESSTFICTECGDGFSQYSSLITHITIHGPLESFSFDGSSNGFEVPREYVLQENGTLTVVNGFAQSHSCMKPASPGILPSHFPSPIKPVSPPLKPQPSSFRDVFKPRQLDLNSDKCRQGHYRCEICSRSFNSLQSLHRHQQYRNTERGYKCTLCCKIFEGRQDLKKHLQDHTRERFYCCDHCGKRFIKEEVLSAHKKESHPKPVGKLENNQERQSEKTYPCKKCKLNFFWMSDYQTHSLHHCKGKDSDLAFETEVEIELNTKDTDDGPLENCHTNGTSAEVKNGNSKAFRNTSSETYNESSSRSYNESFSRSYNESSSRPYNESSSRPYNESSSRPYNESSSRPYRCGLCGDRFQNLAALKEHHLTHQTQEEIDQLNVESEELEKPLKRTVPNKGRKRSSNPNGKLHPCKQCHRVFNHSSSLSRHMRYHKGTMHTCVFCGRHFPQRCDVRRHYVMYHKAELDKKPGLKHLYAPPTNGPGSHSVNRKKNQTVIDEQEGHSSDNEQSSPEDQEKDKQSGKAARINYKCQECGKRFGLLCVYQRHLRYHKKEPNKCPKCPAEFRNLSSLELHLQNHPDVEADVGQAHGTGASQNLGLEKGNAEDIEDEYTDNVQNDKENSSEVLYECTECTETFACLETFLQHQTSHGSEKNE